MRKSFFFSIIALAAVVSCSKSEVIDTKYGNDTIGFQTYLGRDAQTKATPTETEESIRGGKDSGIGVYGFYTGSEDYKQTTSPANLMDNINLYYDPTTVDEKVIGWKYDQTKYWTNDKDLYTFLAYAPYGNSSLVASLNNNNADPSLSYKLPTVTNLGDNDSQIDVLYSNDAQHINMTKNVVALTFKHALSRLTVKASAASTNAFSYHVKNVSITGKFIAEDNFNLYTGKWATLGTIPENTSERTYTYYTSSVDITNDELANANKVPTTGVDYSGKTEGTEGTKYLMMIPTNFSSEANNAILTVEYTTYYLGQESKVIKKEIPVGINFEQGYAYAINLVFEQDMTDVITFTVSVNPWTTATSQPEDIKPEDDTKYPDQNADNSNE